MNLKHYILDAEHHVVEIEDLMTWAHWFEVTSNRIVAWTQITQDVTVSTIFLALDHRWFGKGPPILFETLVFGGPCDGEMRRYVSWDDAETGHKAMVRTVRAAMKQRVKR